MIPILKTNYVFWWVQVFTVCKSEEAELSCIGLGASKTSMGSSTQLRFGYGIVHLFTKQNDWTLILRKSERHGTELQKDSSRLYVCTASKLSKRHGKSTRWWSPSLFHCYIAVPTPKASKSLVMESRCISLPFSFASFESMRLLSMGTSERLLYGEARTTVKNERPKWSKVFIPFSKRHWKTLNNVYENMKIVYASHSET